MKRFSFILIVLAALLAFTACNGGGGAPAESPKPSADPEGYKAMFDEALLLLTDYSDERLARVLHKGELDYNIDQYKQRDKDYLQLVRQEFETTAQKYTETYGSDWKLSYTINSVEVKDAEGIEKYKKFDSFFFDSYGIDTDSITDVVFVKLTVKIEGSVDSNTKDKTIQCFCSDGSWYSFYAVRLGLKL